ncbi:MULTISPECIES: DUF167 domain-containing protein [unclassified Variovorax]|uniref:DUF167 domain-containing protein n=1 Tax=unclassified Variovorax TaxID=663243 RepID=UPI003F5167C7
MPRVPPDPARGPPLKKSSFYRWEGDILVLNILGTPGAAKDAIGKVKGNQLKVSVTEAPRVGRATDHMVRFLAGEFGVSRCAIEVVFGRKNVNKQLRIKAPSRLPACIEPPAMVSPSSVRPK